MLFMGAAAEISNMGKPEIAEYKLLSGDQLMESCGGALRYVSKQSGRAALRSLGLLGRSQQFFEALNTLADTLRPLEFGAYEERGFANRAKSGVIPEMKINVVNVTLNAEYVAAGHFASVYKISSGSGPAFALKVYYQRNAEDFSSGPWSETALGIYVTAQDVSNMPHLCIANPERGWLLAEFVDSHYHSPTPDGPTWADLGLRAFDNAPEGPNEVPLTEARKMRVDYGHMATKEREQLYIQDDLRATLFKLKGAAPHVPSEAFLELFWSRPELRKHLLIELGCLAPEHRLPVLKEAFDAPEAEFLALQDYVLSGLISADKTRELFDLLMTHPNPSYRAQGIFDIRNIAKEDANYLGENWYGKQEFLPFLIFLGEKPFTGTLSPR